jgi:hypothetical protein
LGARRRGGVGGIIRRLEGTTLNNVSRRRELFKNVSSGVLAEVEAYSSTWS